MFGLGFDDVEALRKLKKQSRSTIEKRKEDKPETEKKMNEKRDLESKPTVTDTAEEEKSKEESTALPPATKKPKIEAETEKEAKSNIDEKDTQPEVKNNPEAKVNHEELSANALVIFGLHPLIKKDEMNEVMSKYGKVERVEIRKAFASTYCFCDYETSEEAQKAIDKLNGTKLRDKGPLIVKLANDNTSRSKPRS